MGIWFDGLMGDGVLVGGGGIGGEERREGDGGMLCYEDGI